MKKNFENKGITLIALIITVIILLILAGAAISISINGGDLFGKAQNAVMQYNAKVAEEETKINEVWAILNSINGEGAPIEVVNSEEWNYTINTENNTATVYGYKGEETEITIPSYIEKDGVRYTVNKIGYNYNNGDFSNNTQITSVKIQSNITEIADSAFINSTRLQSVIMENGVEKMENSIFQGCTSLKNVRLSDSIRQIGINCFNGCTNLEQCNIPNELTAIPESMFNQCVSLKSITIPNKVKVIGPTAFTWCFSLEIIEIPSNVETISNYAFSNVGNADVELNGVRYNGKLKKIILHEGIKEIGIQAFVQCNTVEEDLTKPSTVTSVGENAFLNFGSVGGGKLIGWE